MIGARWHDGEAVRLTRNVRNDGTYPGLPAGAPLVARGSVGYVVDVGSFLQDQIIYSVNFLDQGRTIGCREEELIAADQPWTPPRFEFRDRVRATRRLAIDGAVLIDFGAIGEVLRVVDDQGAGAADIDGAGGFAYQVHFDALPGRVLQIPEAALAAAAESEHDDAPQLP